jgi:hypothetical protein
MGDCEHRFSSGRGSVDGRLHLRTAISARATEPRSSRDANEAKKSIVADLTRPGLNRPASPIVAGQLRDSGWAR